MTLTPSTVARIRTLLAKATPGPWQSKNDEEWDIIIGNVDGPDDGEFDYTEVCDCNPDGPAAFNVPLIVELVNNADALLAAAEAKAWRSTREEIARCVDRFAVDHPHTSVLKARAAKAYGVADAILALSPPTPAAKP